MKISGIYKITNLINKKDYICKSKNIKNRWYNHIYNANKKYKFNLYFAMNNYGINNFKFEIIKKTYDLEYWEKFFIFWYESKIKGYNMTDGGDGYDFSNLIRTKEHCIHISESLKNSIKAHESSSKNIRNYNLSQKGIPLSVERKRNIGLGGKKSWEKDKTRGIRSIETRRKNGFLNQTLETKNKISQSLKGNHKYNNGIKNIWAKECPEGFVSGWIK
jgi:group I intron endonuclease